MIFFIFDCFLWRDVLRLLLENLSDEVGSTRAMVFGALTEMLKQESLIVSFQGFTELIILKVLEAHRDEEKDVSLSSCFLRRPQKLTKSSPSIWHLLHNVKSTEKISSIFVAFLENTNLKKMTTTLALKVSKFQN